MPDQAAIEMGRTGPALSATSDAPNPDRPAPAISAVAGKGNPDVAFSTVKPAEATVEGETKEAAKEKVEKTETKEGTEGDNADKGDEAQERGEDGKFKTSKEDKTDKGVQREITKERNRRREAERKANGTEEQLRSALSALEALGKKTPAQVKEEVSASPKPKREDFQDPDTYEAALITWTTETTTRALEARREQTDSVRATEEAQQKQQEEAQKANLALQKKWGQDRDAALEKYPDYEEVAESDDVHISAASAFAIMNADNGTDIAYYLGKNPKEAERIAALPPLKQQLEIGRLSLKLEDGEKRSVTKAPPPVKTAIRSRERAAEESASEETMEEYAARRQREISAKRTNAKPS